VASVRAIASKDNPLLVRLRKLATDPSAYRKLGEVWLEGDHLCAAFLQRGGTAPLAVITEGGWEQPSLRQLASRASSVVLVPAILMAGLSGLESPPPLGFAVPWSGAAILQPEAPSVVLDRLQDAGNVGTILRSAAAFGFTQVLAIKGTAALWSPRVLRAGMGAHFGLNLVEGVEVGMLESLAAPLLATSSHAVRGIDELVLPWPCAFAFGNEGQGLSTTLLQRCRAELCIPQPGGEESLNVASAAAVCMYESARQRATATRQRRQASARPRAGGRA
jgi:TrmH family RNA methyltransferase